MSGTRDRRWLLVALALILAFMAGEVFAAVVAGSLALLSDATHMLTDAAALGLAVVASRVVERPARGHYTYGFGRVDALAAQINGLVLVLLAGWFVVEAVRRLVNPPAVTGGLVVVTAVVGVGVNLAATLAASRADRRHSLNVRGAVAHLVNDLWAFVATAAAGTVVVLTGWSRADPIASLVVAGLMVLSGVRLLRASGRVFLEAAPTGVDPAALGRKLTGLDGVTEVHDLHVWDLGGERLALSAHVLVGTDTPCHDVSHTIRRVLRDDYAIDHATLQVDHDRGEAPVNLSPPRLSR